MDNYKHLTVSHMIDEITVEINKMSIEEKQWVIDNVSPLLLPSISIPKLTDNPPKYNKIVYGILKTTLDLFPNDKNDIMNHLLTSALQ